MAIDADDRATQLDVTILGREYRVACAADEREELLRAVAYLDSRMREIRDVSKVSGIDRIAVMAALNIANELLRERREPSPRSAGPSVPGGETAIDRLGAQRRIRDMQAAIDATLNIRQGPDTDTIGNEGRNADGCHMNEIGTMANAALWAAFIK